MSPSTSQIFVSPQSQIDSVLEQVKPSHMITLVSPGTQITTPDIIHRDNHLCLYFNDINGPRDTLIPPSYAMVEAVLAFVHSWDQSRSLLIHCYAGISRSTAAAYLAMMALEPTMSPVKRADQLRQLAPSATPNPLMIAHGDHILGHGGALISAIKKIGRGADAFEGTPFAFQLAAKR